MMPNVSRGLNRSVMQLPSRGAGDGVLSIVVLRLALQFDLVHAVVGQQ